MKRKLASVGFPNNRAAIEFHHVEDVPGVPKKDVVSLTFRRKKKQTVVHMRPDEAMAVIRVLSKGLHKMITDYAWFTLKGRKT
jgi:hypothetical protein